MKVAIVAVAYNRINSLSRLLSSLEKAYYEKDDKITLIISVDKSNTDEVEIYADKYNWDYGPKIVDKHKHNLGLRPHMMSLGKWFNDFDALIILEDDIVVSPNFYSYSLKTIEKYHSCSDIAGISLYSFATNYHTGNPFSPLKNEFDVYFMNCAMSWGEIWMKESWLKFYEWYLYNQDFNYTQTLPRSICSWNNKSWLKYHTRYCIEQNKYFVHPYISLSTNFSDAGEHADGNANTIYQVPLQFGRKNEYILPNFGIEGSYYDGFFENKSIYNIIELNENDLCIDLNGEWNNRLNKRFWITTKKYNYKILRSYGLNYKPIELNILYNNIGNDIFLYDTTITEKNILKKNKKDLLYLYNINGIVYFIKKYELKNILYEITNIIKKKLLKNK